VLAAADGLDADHLGLHQQDRLPATPGTGE
jgi:hypothetical protein